MRILNTPRIIAIDDEPAHLAGLTNGLNLLGVQCRSIHYTGVLDDIVSCPGVRVIFADLHLGSGVLSSDPTTDFSVLGSLLENSIKPSGPYTIVLWTMYPDQASALHVFLERLHGVTKPVEVLAMSKPDFIDGEGNIKDETHLKKQIDALAGAWMHPQGALALKGAWGDLDDQVVDNLMDEIYKARRIDKGRTVEMEN